MDFVTELLEGTWLVELRRVEDIRGSFVKTFARSAFDEVLSHELGQDVFELREEFYSTSARDVIRGMHFQAPPHDHIKLVYCAVGAVTDVLLDLRRGPAYGRTVDVLLQGTTPSLVVIPKGVAHGFRSLTDNSLMVYKTSSEYSPTHDGGIRFDSFGFDWKCETPVLSARDREHPRFADFVTPF